MRKISDEKIFAMRELYKEGVPINKISKMVGSSPDTVKKYCEGPDNTLNDDKEDKTSSKSEQSSVSSVSNIFKSIEDNDDGIRNYIQGIIKSANTNPNVGFGLGIESGVNLSNVVKNFFKILDGDATWPERLTYALNTAGLVSGILGGSNEFDKIYKKKPKNNYTDSDIDAIAIRTFENGGNPIDIVKAGICSMERAKKLWDEYTRFKKDELEVINNEKTTNRI